MNNTEDTKPREITIIESEFIRHPEGLFCPICGCGEIRWWSDLDRWDQMNDEEKKKFEICPCCGYGEDDFPYDEFE